jgi:hypothetical protein
MPDLLNAAALAKSILYKKWLPPYGRPEVQKCQTELGRYYPRMSTPKRHLFPWWRPDHITLVISLLYAWSNHQTAVYNQTAMTNLVILGGAIVLANPTHTYWSWPWCIKIMINVRQLWFGWSMYTYNFHTIQSEPIHLAWKRIGYYLGGMYSSTKRSCWRFLKQALANSWRRILARWHPPVAKLTPWTIPLSGKQPQ